ncbi:MAG: UDP-N-acetylmuramate:L-alanyl-gamma-D-glutamyl-meso-diaminopimelate ligase [Pseudomonadota bacterium]|jgi:UDP-N-acetylmuramate: L-alanyl-gamma-D-glutamyl-meso-diaminopimelate ligase|nr:UDP-N-acetylmuramate:L-alanyl-gamma-D-glutamyl-meso-diaminopimelate ligase [Pseudomonadales bacterium]MEC7766110.1 UDP-N-acetylmuramate:L-alanyl-gamma-D-glutamyl-meso-diaminopimelate ligase [Pseudomonadota bacterium]HBX98720.1 UDP-N-acetylmuramate:L-alanyl-gamma-D-glutamyl-meso-diaminopimelate ligase [Gammaproteobacteria bacterium]MEC8950735.1 UDP-N-acetylmuramate:L-alanyl-gamma-D-glutamyl-meso-diaminopimelate ligase [Pseudomonadota bacterium]MEC8995286.1 UDP-N-acetylmuramate:L-alanyl-gamma-|tara:strand:- start:1496 stop:2929 length:1434 start_codon:yes stop_codon:yes gene_type:complete
MHIHILGICGTFMGSLAVLAKQMGYQVSGSDSNVYPPMSTQLQDQGIALQEGFQPEHMEPPPDLVIIGNALSRGNPAVEYVLNKGLNYTSGPQWLSRFVLNDKWVVGVAGTHGKTTTSAMLAWMLEFAGMKPGYLIGGVTNNFPMSASLGDSPFFILEADEYDSAFFDKRSKFVHYAPRTAILNNLEYDHADIFEDLDAIKKQFHHLIRTIPGNGLIIAPYDDSVIRELLRMGCWTGCQQFGIDVPDEVCKTLVENEGVFWNALINDNQGSEFELIKYGKGSAGEVVNRAVVNWELTGIHNVRNAIAAVAAAHHVGLEVATACDALFEFKGVKRRMELCGVVNGITVYDDFAHHPTAIKMTLQGMAAKLEAEEGPSRLIAVIEPRSNTMKLGIHQHELNIACQPADMVVWFKPEDANIDFDTLIRESKVPGYAFFEIEQIVRFLKENCHTGDHIVIMSNGSFGDIHKKLLHVLKQTS